MNQGGNRKLLDSEKIRKMRGLDVDQNGNTWLGIILDVWLATFGIEAQAKRKGH